MTTQLTPAPAPDTTARRDHIYPTLTAAQLARLATHGRRRRVEQGEVLVQAGEHGARPVGVVGGENERGPPSAPPGGLVVSLRPRGFNGRGNLPLRRPGAAPH